VAVAATVPAVSSRNRWLLAGLVVWTVFVWANRISNAWSSTEETTSAKVISSVLAAVFLAFAIAGAVIWYRLRSHPLDRTSAAVLVGFAVLTTVVWVVRIVAIVAADHSVGFKAVHVALGVISIALALPVAREARASGTPKPVSTAA
jgi:hypothetical protein